MPSRPQPSVRVEVPGHMTGKPVLLTVDDDAAVSQALPATCGGSTRSAFAWCALIPASVRSRSCASSGSPTRKWPCCWPITVCPE